MAAIIWQADHHTHGFSQQNMCAEECVEPRNYDDEYIALSLETIISCQRPLVAPLAGQQSLLQSLQLQKDACGFSDHDSKNESAVASSKQNNELCHLEAPPSPKPLRIDFVGTLLSSETRNPSGDKICKCNIPSKFSVGGHKIDPNAIMGSTHTPLCQQKSRPYKVVYKESKKRKLGSWFNEKMTIKQPSCLSQKTKVHSKSCPSYTFQQGDHSMNEKYAPFRTTIRKLGKPSQSFPPRLKSEQTMCPPWELDLERYFDTLQGPELDRLKDHEDSLLPLDEIWPFLLRFPIGCFSISLGLGSQTVLWKTLSSAHTMQFMHIPRHINLILWWLALMALFAVFTTYILKCFFYFEAVRREFFHPIRINFFFAPWIACMMLTLGIPPAISETVHPIILVVFMGPVFALELKIYGQWLSGGKRRLSRVANPSTHMSLLGNFIGAQLAAAIGWKEIAIFFWAVGFAHYFVLFVTLYQRSPFTTRLPKELHPVYFLFVATPSTASVAWSQILDHFDLVSRLAYFLALFLYLSLVVRANFFRGFRFSMTWWAYTFPMTTLANATIHYSLDVKRPLIVGLAVMLSIISSVVFLSLSLFTMLHLYWGTMFPNDVAIAISEQNYQIKQKHKGLQGHESCKETQRIDHKAEVTYCEEKTSFTERV